ncbi:MAG: flagellar biosynthesis protein [Rhodobacteraceae bacterium]|jgi:flagellar assembly protein FliH|uniref:flagellar biosynthesis protein n=1 Tax=Albidovulum sp. TaxID=1872424 RepID=UPI001D552CA0|nr:flagellar biosynthesis protein [uncultured Defluviimonas sp.]MCB2124432.1 flagellar biosynthesis protein [Paracoccaceae bacterium]MCC0070581.1 flagellar biosynthesis protein [Paracoccaceae bacterium]
MPRLLQFEVFEVADRSTPRAELAQDELEEARLQSYEQGYAAGWDDAVAAQDGEIARLRADLGRNLEDLSFTYHEAHSHVLRTLEPLLHDMVTKVLPAIARESLGHVVLDHLRPLARELAGAPITVVANPINRPLIETLLTAGSEFPLSFADEASLGEGQVYLKLGEAEARVDLDGVIAAISAAVSAFFRIEKQEDRRHG